METQYAIHADGVVRNVIVADANFVAIYCPGAVRIDNLTPVPGIGWSYVGGVFSAPESEGGE